MKRLFFIIVLVTALVVGCSVEENQDQEMANSSFDQKTAALLETVSGAYNGFVEDFSAGLSNWYPVVYNSYSGSEYDPPPVIDPSMGLEAPSLDVNGNGWCGNGAYSVETFDYSKGLNIEWDMYVASGYDWNWGNGGLSNHMPNLTAPRSDGAYIDNTRCDPQYIVSMGIMDDGMFNMRPPSLGMGIYASDNTGDGYGESDATYLENAWHHYKIAIKTDGHVDFFIDGELKYSTVKTINTTFGALPLLFGSRDAYGPVRIDNVKVTSAVVPVSVDIKPGSEPNCINNNGNGVIPVAILGDADFDVRAIDAGSVMLEGLVVKIAGKSNKLMAHYEDVNSDGFEDLMVQIQDEVGAFEQGATVATVTGVLLDGTLIEGADSICLVP